MYSCITVIGWESHKKLGFSKEIMFNRCEFTVINGMNTEQVLCDDIATIEFFPNPNDFNCYTISVNRSRVDNSLLISDISLILYSQTEKEKLMQWALGLEPIGFKVQDGI